MKKSNKVKHRVLVALTFIAFISLVKESQGQTLVSTPLNNSSLTPGQYYSNSEILMVPGFSVDATTGPYRFYIDQDCIPYTNNFTLSFSYIATSTPKKSGSQLLGGGTCDLIQSIQYVDGLGRPLQNIKIKGSPTGKDIVEPFSYDQYGRESKKYLPYTLTTGVSDGSYRSNALTDGVGQNSFFTIPPTGVSSISNPYATTEFEPSSLNRITGQGAPGESWQPLDPNIPNSGHTVKTIYAVNNSIDLSDTANTNFVALYYISAINNDQSRTLSRGVGVDGFYSSGRLILTVTRDENWKSGKGGTIEEYKDKEDHLVLKRTFNYVQGSTPALQILSTYYVYDDLGNLAYVLPPKSNADNAIPNQTILDNLCYQYRYDERNRLTQKRIPGKKDWDLIVYNKLDQPVLTQDASQRLNYQWTVTKYDAHGRIYLTGLWNAGSLFTLSALQSNIYANPQWDVRNYSDNTIGYSITSYPLQSKILTINYYDDYNNLPLIPTIYKPDIGTYSTLTQGLLTATKTSILNTLDSTPQMLATVNYYDEKGRDKKIYKQHYLNGAVSQYNYDEISNEFDFTDHLTASTRVHYKRNSDDSNKILALKISYTWDYDHLGRKVRSSQKINEDQKIIVSNLVYNEIDQLWIKKLHSENDQDSYLQTLTSKYNERGWLVSNLSNSSLFNFYLFYNVTPDVGVSKQYNGNVAQMMYSKTGANDVKFQYQYDQMNRLVNSTSSTGQLNENIGYDIGSNILSINRTGTAAVNLSYDYYNNNLDNRLQFVKNNGTAFRTYSYDENGNATSDGSAKDIIYNLINLPKEVKTSGTTIVSYIYDANGYKLRSVGSDGVWDYVNGIVYKNNSINYIQTEEGKAELLGSSYKFQYFLKDNVGNVRLSIDKDLNGNPRRLQEDEYYAFGQRSPFYDNSNGNKYLFNGKELQVDLSNQYDFGARFYDPVIARWTSIDSKAIKMDSYSPYNYALNNPILLNDESGQEPNRAQATTIQEFIKFLRANNLTTIASIYNYVKNNSTVNARYIYTQKNGWIDVNHVFSVLHNGKNATDFLEPLSGIAILSGTLFGGGAVNSYYSYEDLPSNEFGDNLNISKEVEVTSPNGKYKVKVDVTLSGEELFAALTSQFLDAGATTPATAPNYKKIPKSKDRKAIVKNGLVKEPSKEQLATGEYVPQNHTSKPYDLTNFPAAPTSIEAESRNP